LKKNIAVIMAAVMLLAGFAPVLHANLTKVQTENYMPDVCDKAQADANMETNWALWLSAGCLISLVGLLLAHFITPSPPEERLVGKKSAYVSVYMECYQARAKEITTNGALAGCILGAIIYTTILGVIFVAVVFKSAFNSI
jgi:hypothetical protein